MTWDLLLLRIPPEIETAEDLSEDAVIPLGAPSDVRANIQRALPQTQFGDETTGRLATTEYSIQLSLGDADPVRGVLLLISGETARATSAVASLCAATGWRAFDMNTEEFVAL